MAAADTIAAVATAPGRAGIGVVRVSGPGVPLIASGILNRTLRPRVATLCDFLDDQARLVDRGIAILYAAPHSYTGEDLLELQGHGGPAVLSLILRRCLDLGARPAQPGEFTQRAFLNDKLDLAQAESVADLIDASSEAAVRSAVRSLAGEFSTRVTELNLTLIDLRALVEATLDFPEEEEVEILDRAGAAQKLRALRDEVAAVLAHAEQGRILRDGARVVLIGQPNVGKSSLMNRLSEQEVAIVTEIPGTTRDALRHELAIEGVPVHVVDTAGLRTASDVVERIGIERAWREIRQADLALLVVDATAGLTEADRAIQRDLPADLKKLVIFNKIDLLSGAARGADSASSAVFVSARTGAGFESLRQAILREIGWTALPEGPFSARERHLHALREAVAALESAVRQRASLELMAEELRLAQRAFERITGKFSADDLLGEIFSRFCIGK